MTKEKVENEVQETHSFPNRLGERNDITHTLLSRQIASFVIPPPFFGSLVSQSDQSLFEISFLSLVENHHRRMCRTCRVGHTALVTNIGSELIMSQLYKLIPLGTTCVVSSLRVVDYVRHHPK
jgi:hypothetical protein